MVKGKETVEKTKPEVEKTKDVVEKTKKADKPDKGFFVYLGPNIRGLVQKGSIYEGPRSEVETLLADAIKKYPGINTLIVSGDTLPEDKIKVRTPGNYLYEAYRKLVAELKQ